MAPPRLHTSAYVSIRQHTSTYVSIRERRRRYGAAEGEGPAGVGAISGGQRRQSARLPLRPLTPVWAVGRLIMRVVLVCVVCVGRSSLAWRTAKRRGAAFYFRQPPALSRELVFCLLV
jgi:hypothetical protein